MHRDRLIGCTLAIFGHIAINLGANLLKLSHTRKEASRHTKTAGGGAGDVELVNMSQVTPQLGASTPVLPTARRRCGCCCSVLGLWVIGFLSFAVGSTINFVAFSFAEQSLLAALGSVQFIT